MAGLALASCRATGSNDARPRAIETTPSDAPCSELLHGYDDQFAFKLIYEPRTGRWTRQSNAFHTELVGAHAVDSQRIVVCIDSVDQRSTYEVDARLTDREALLNAELRQSGEVGATQVEARAQITAPNPQSAFINGFAPATTYSEPAASSLGAYLCEMLRITGSSDQCNPAPGVPGAPPLAPAPAPPAPALYESMLPEATQRSHRQLVLDALANLDLLHGTAEQEIKRRAYEVLLGQVHTLEWQRYLEPLMLATGALEQERVQSLRAILDGFERPVNVNDARVLREVLGRLLLEDNDDEGRRIDCHGDTDCFLAPPFALPRLVVEQHGWIAFTSYINRILPDWIWVVDGRVVVRTPTRRPAPPAGGGAAATNEALTELDDAVSALSQSIERTWHLIEFTQEALLSLRPPRRVWDFGIFQGDRVITLQVRRNERQVHMNGATLELRQRASTSTRIEEVHKLEQFRIEPGVAVSFRGNPNFRLENNGAGDQIIASSAAVDGQLFPVVFLHATLCGLDLRTAPLFRTCNTGDVLRSPLPRAFAANIGLSVGFTPSTQIYRNAFLGLSFQFFPFVTLGTGLHLGSWRHLAPGFEAGDRFTGPQSALDAVVRDDFGVSGYFTITLGSDVWTRFRGFTYQ